MDFSLHFDFDIHNDKKITTHEQNKLAKKDPEQSKVHPAEIP